MPSSKRIRLRDLRKSPGFVTHEQLASVIDAVVLIDEQTGGGGGGAAWFDGAGTPSSGLGNNGDYYLNTTNGDVYEKAGGTWSVIGNIKGPTGATGATGATGPAGPAGPGVAIGGTAGQILAKIDATNYNTEWIDNFTSQIKHEVKAGVALTKGQAVYVTGSTGGSGTNMIVGKSDNTTEATSSKTMGLIAQDLAVNGFGYVITEGLLAGFDTSAANAAGDSVWLGTNGNLLYGISNKPSAPAHMVFIGIVTRKQSNNGEIFVKVQNGFELEELHNVAISSIANNNLLMYEAATALWKNKTLAQIITAALGNGISGQLLQTDGSGGFTWQNGGRINAAYSMDTTETSVTGTVETINKTLLLPANRFSAQSSFKTIVRIRKDNQGFNQTTIRIYIGTNPASFGSATLIATYVFGAVSGFTQIILERSLLIHSATQTIFNLTANTSVNDVIGGVQNIVNIDWTVNQYIIITTATNNAAYTAFVRSIQIIPQ